MRAWVSADSFLEYTQSMAELASQVETSLAGITENQRKLLDELQDLWPLTNQDIFVIALVYLGLKPAAKIDLTFQKGPSDYTEQNYEQDIDQVRQFIRKMGLWYEQQKIDPEENDEDQTIWTSFYIGTSPQKAAGLHQAFSHGKKDEKAKLLGYPDTAIQAYPENSVRGLPTELSRSDMAPFMYFVPSRENWVEEIETLQESVRLVRQLMPELYQRMVRKLDI